MIGPTAKELRDSAVEVRRGYTRIIYESGYSHMRDDVLQPLVADALSRIDRRVGLVGGPLPDDIEPMPRRVRHRNVDLHAGHFLGLVVDLGRAREDALRYHAFARDALEVNPDKWAADFFRWQAAEANEEARMLRQSLHQAREEIRLLKEDKK